MPSRFLKNQWHFCHVWHNPENRFELERKREWLLNLSVRSNFKWTNQSSRWNDLGTVVVDPITRLRGKLKGRILRQIFRSLWAFRPAKHTYSEWNLLGFMERLVLLRFGTFLFEEKASDRWSGFPANRGLSRRNKNERFAVAHRETRKCIRSFN